MAVTVDQLHIKSRTTDQQDKVVAQLDRIAWPTIGEDEYLIIRSLKSKGRVHEMARLLENEAYKKAQASVDGWSPAAVDAEAVIFYSHADLIACLSRDLITGRATSLWFWQSWKYLFKVSVSQAISDLWSSKIELLPTITRLLHQHQALTSVWKSLSPSSANQLVILLKRVITGLPSHFEQEIKHVGRVHQISDAQKIKWRHVLAGYQQDSPQYQLAILSEILAMVPHQIHSSLVTQAYHELMEALPSADYARRMDENVLAARESELKAKPAIVFDGNNLNTDFPFQDISDSQALIESPGSNVSKEHRQHKPHKKTASELVEHKTLENTNGYQADTQPSVSEKKALYNKAEQPIDKSSLTKEINPVVTKESQPVVTEQQIITPQKEESITQEYFIQQGGIFYLINVLNLPAIREPLFANPDAIVFPSAWGWLYRLAQALGLASEKALNEMLARLCGFDNPETLQDLPELPDMKNLLSYAEQRYETFHIWNPALLNTPAQVVLKPMYIDVYYAMEHLNIDVRRAALDVDPGWLPWLGHVIRFHYGNTLVGGHR